MNPPGPQRSRKNLSLWIEITEGLRISWLAIRANKVRSGLTTLGIVIGIVTVTLMGTAITGLNRAFTQSVSAIGADVLYVERYSWFGDEEWWKTRNRREITLAQAREVERSATLARAVNPAGFTRQSIHAGKRSGGNVNIIGMTHTAVDIFNLILTDGRYMSPAESDGDRPVCVVGHAVAANLYPNESPVGKKLTIGNRTFEVIGAIEKRGKFLGLFSMDEEVHIPIRQFRTAFDRRPDVRIDIKVADMSQIDEAREEIRAIMRKARKLAPGDPDDFAINQQDAFIQNFNKVGGTIASIGLFVTGLSLFVGGIGIMNIMFVSVTERTKEIGLRKAIGARQRTILMQFLIEAILICLLGGLIGIGIAWPLTFAMQQFLPATLSLTVVAIALSVSTLTGVISGFMPAYRAARMNPVDALRAE